MTGVKAELAASHYSRAEGDRIAGMVLALVAELVRGVKVRTPLLPVPEPTGVRVDRDMEDAVMRRSA